MKKRMPNSCTVAGFVALILCAAGQARETPATKKVSFDITAPNLVQALMQFTEQSGLQLAFPASGTDDMPAPRVVGDYTPKAALEQLLAGTRLQYTFANERTISVRATEGSLTDSLGVRLVATPSEPSREGSEGASVAATSGRDTSTVRSSRGTSDGTSSDRRRETMEQVVVTGTNIRGATPDSSPVKTYNREEIDRSGVSTVDQFVRKIPENFASVDGGAYGVANTAGGLPQTGANSTFGAGMNLHGLGPGATLVLLNGHRVAPSGDSGGFVDISMIPLAALERIEIVSDGASAIYGADAVAGVANFVLRKDFTGGETSLRYGGATRGGDTQFVGSQALGTSWRSGSGLIVYEHDKQEGLESSRRDFVSSTASPGMLLPEQQRNSFFGTATQDVGAASLTTDGFFSSREFADDSFQLPLRAEGRARQYGSSLGLNREFGSKLTASANVNYSKTTQSYEILSVGAPSSSFATDTNLLEADARVSGALLTLPGGSLKAALGGDWRQEKYATSVSPFNEIGALARHVVGAYAEFLIPLVGPSNARAGVQRFDLSLAGRFEHYGDFGSSTNPKVGLLWSPATGLNLRGTYANSFRAPMLPQLIAPTTYFLFPLPDPSSPTGRTNTLINNSRGNPDLSPEESKSYTVGFDIRPPSAPSLTINSTYFHTHFDRRISNPPIPNGLTALFQSAAASSTLLQRSPDLTTVQTIFDTGTVTNPLGLSPAAVGAIFDNRLLNLAATTESGVSLAVGYESESDFGRIFMSVDATYLLEVDYQALSTTPVVSLMNDLGEPVDLRVRSTVGFTRGAAGVTLMLNYANGYTNSLWTPEESVASWFTADLQLTYRTREAPRSFLQGLQLALSIQNLTDRDPPIVRVPTGFVDVGYDAVNASPVGRALALQIRKRW